MIDQEERDAQKLRQHGLALGFRGMRGEHDFDRELVEEFLDLRRRDAARAEVQARFLRAIPLRRMIGQVLVMALAAYAVNFLRQIDQLKIEREGTNDLGGRGKIERFIQCRNCFS